MAGREKRRSPFLTHPIEFGVEGWVAVALASDAAHGWFDVPLGEGRGLGARGGGKEGAGGQGGRSGGGGAP